jgi:hypothetical protein
MGHNDAVECVARPHLVERGSSCLRKGQIAQAKSEFMLQFSQPRGEQAATNSESRPHLVPIISPGPTSCGEFLNSSSFVAACECGAL